jgi:hypothetical protein
MASMSQPVRRARRPAQKEERRLAILGAARKLFRTVPYPELRMSGVAESLDWAMALLSLHRDHLDAATLEQTLGCVLKVHEDRGVMQAHRGEIAPVLGEAAGTLDSGGSSLDTDFGFGSVSAPRADIPRSLPELAAFCRRCATTTASTSGLASCTPLVRSTW